MTMVAYTRTDGLRDYRPSLCATPPPPRRWLWLLIGGLILGVLLGLQL